MTSLPDITSPANDERSRLALAGLAAAAEMRGGEFFRGLIDALPAAVYTTDAEGRITYFNEAAATLWGHRPELGKSEWCGSWRLFHPDGAPLPHDQCPMAVAVRERRAVRGVEAIAERPDGTRVPFIPYPTPLHDADGAFIGAVNLLVDITERQASEEALRESEARFGGIVAQATTGIALTDLTGHFRFVNRRYCDMVGYSEAALYRMRMQDITHPDDLPGNLERFENLARTGADFVIEKRYVRGDGSVVWVNNSVCGVRDARGAIASVVAVSLDVTDRRAAEQALTRQTVRLDTLNRIARTISSDLDLEHIVQTATDAATQLCGAQFGAFFYNVVNERGEAYQLYTLSGAPREAFERFGLPRNTAVFEATFRGAAIVRSDDIRADVRYGKSAPHYGMPRGHLPVVSYLAAPVVSRSGEVHGGLFFGHDQPGIFTAESEAIVSGIAAHAAIAIDNARLYQSAQMEIERRREAEQAAQKLAAIVQSSDDSIVSVDLDGTITSWNRGAERLFGYAGEETVGQPITILLPPGRDDEEPGILDRVRRGERIDHYETVRRRKNGGLIDISLSVSPTRNADGEIIGAAKIARDITERKRADELQQLLLNETKHRVKNTLATVQAIAYQTMSRDADGEREAFIARLQAMANAHDLLRLENWNRTRLRDVVSSGLGPFLDSHADRISVSGPDEVWLNPDRSLLLTMVLHELATNAIKYGALSGDGGEVEVVWEPTENSPERIRLIWRERGGPPVSPPTHKGFGSRLITRSLRGELGDARFDFRPDGLVCTLELAL